MKALVYHGNKDLRYESAAEQPIRRGEVRLAVRYSGLCHTDFNEYQNGPLYVSRTPHKRTGRSVPLILGHEFSGEIVDKAPDVQNLHLGDRVAVSAVDSCGRCEFCRTGFPTQCSETALIGFGRDGGYAESVVVPAACCHLLGANVSLAAGALVEPLAVALHAVNPANAKPGATAAVIGGGTIGLATLQALQACGIMEIYIVEKSPAKRPFADLLGTTAFVDVLQTDAPAFIRDKTGGFGVDFAFECVGSSAALKTALSVTRPGGTVCLLGIVPHPVEFDWNEVLSQEKMITTALAYSNEFPTVIAMLNAGKLCAEPMITRSVSLRDSLDALIRFEEGGKSNIKTLIDLSKD